MSDDTLCDHDDLGTALREGRGLHPSRHYRIEVGIDGLDFETVHVSETAPVGAHILQAAGIEGSNEISLLAILASGEFEEVMLDQRFDLRGRGAERFVAFRTDRLFKLTLDGRLLQWGRARFEADVLYRLARVGEGEAIFLEAPGGRRMLERGDEVDLGTPGVERFFKGQLVYEIFVNSRPRNVTARKVTFEQVVDLAFPGAPTSGFAFSMTFRHVASSPHQGELAATGFVEIKSGSVFNVTRTVQS